MSAWDIIQDTFEDDHCRTFMLYMSHLAAEPPDAPVTGRLAYGAPRQQHSGRPLPKGGSGALTQALGQFIEAHGGVISVNKWVKSLIIENGKCVGVECSDGSSYRASKAVVSTIHIKHLVDMAPKELWGEDFVFGVETWQAENAMFVTHYATSEPPIYKVDGGTLSPVESGILASPYRALRFGYDDARGAVNLEQSAAANNLLQRGGRDTRAGGNAHIEGSRLAALSTKGRPGTLGQDQVRRFRCQPQIFAPLRAESDGRQNPGALRGESSRSGTHESALLAWQRPCRRAKRRAIRSNAAHARLGATSHAHSWPLPDGSYHSSWRLCHRRPGRNAATVMLKDFGTSIEEVVAKKA